MTEKQTFSELYNKCINKPDSPADTLLDEINKIRTNYTETSELFMTTYTPIDNGNIQIKYTKTKNEYKLILLNYYTFSELYNFYKEYEKDKRNRKQEKNDNQRCTFKIEEMIRRIGKNYETTEYKSGFKYSINGITITNTGTVWKLDVKDFVYKDLCENLNNNIDTINESDCEKEDCDNTKGGRKKIFSHKKRSYKKKRRTKRKLKMKRKKSIHRRKH